MSKRPIKVDRVNEMITRHKSTQQKRQLRNIDRSMKKITELLRSPTRQRDGNKKTKSPNKNEQIKLQQSKQKYNKSPRKRKIRKTVIGNKNLVKNDEYCPKKKKRKLDVKKVLLKPNQNLQLIGMTNKRKRRIPNKGYNLQEVEPDELLYSELDVLELVRYQDECGQMDDEDFMEILTCPSPVWWEEPVGEEYCEDAIWMRTPEPMPTSDLEIAPPTTVDISEIQLHNKDEKFIKKRTKLEDLLVNIRSKKLDGNDKDSSLDNSDENDNDGQIDDQTDDVKDSDKIILTNDIKLNKDIKEECYNDDCDDKSDYDDEQIDNQTFAVKDILQTNNIESKSNIKQEDYKESGDDKSDQNNDDDNDRQIDDQTDDVKDSNKIIVTNNIKLNRDIKEECYNDSCDDKSDQNDDDWQIDNQTDDVKESDKIIHLTNNLELNRDIKEEDSDDIAKTPKNEKEISQRSNIKSINSDNTKKRDTLSKLAQAYKDLLKVKKIEPKMKRNSSESDLSDITIPEEDVLTNLENMNIPIAAENEDKTIKTEIDEKYKDHKMNISETEIKTNEHKNIENEKDTNSEVKNDATEIKAKINKTKIIKKYYRKCMQILNPPKTTKGNANEDIFNVLKDMKYIRDFEQMINYSEDTVSCDLCPKRYKKIFLRDNSTINYCMSCSSIFDTDNCAYCDGIRENNDHDCSLCTLCTVGHFKTIRYEEIAMDKRKVPKFNQC